MKVDTASGVYWSIMDLVLQLEPCLFPLNAQQMVLSYAFQLLCIRGIIPSVSVESLHPALLLKCCSI